MPIAQGEMAVVTVSGCVVRAYLRICNYYNHSLADTQPYFCEMVRKYQIGIANLQEVGYNLGMDRAEETERRKRMLDEMAKRRGQTVKRLRERKGWTMAELARRAGVSESYISRFESGSIPSAAAQVVSDLATALEVSVDYIMHQDGSRTAPNNATRTTEPDVNDPELKVYLSNVGGLPEHDRNLIKGVIKQMLDLEEQRRTERNRGRER